MNNKFNLSIVENNSDLGKYFLKVKFLDLNIELPEQFQFSSLDQKQETIVDCFLQNFSLPLIDNLGELELTISYDCFPNLEVKKICLPFQETYLYPGSSFAVQNATFYENLSKITITIPNNNHKFDYLKNRLALPDDSLLWVTEIKSDKKSGYISHYYFKKL